MGIRSRPAAVERAIESGMKCIGSRNAFRRLQGAQGRALEAKGRLCSAAGQLQRSLPKANATIAEAFDAYLQ